MNPVRLRSIVGLAAASVCLVTCQRVSPDAPDVPAPTPAVNSMVGLWRPATMPLRIKESGGTLTKAQFQFNADKTFHYEQAAEWPANADLWTDARKPISLDSFFVRDGRRLTVELPWSPNGEPCMLSPDGKSFTANVVINSAIYTLTFCKQSG